MDLASNLGRFQAYKSKQTEKQKRIRNSSRFFRGNNLRGCVASAALDGGWKKTNRKRFRLQKSNFRNFCQIQETLAGFWCQNQLPWEIWLHMVKSSGLYVAWSPFSDFSLVIHRLWLHGSWAMGRGPWAIGQGPWATGHRPWTERHSRQTRGGKSRTFCAHVQNHTKMVIETEGREKQRQILYSPWGQRPWWIYIYRYWIW